MRTETERTELKRDLYLKDGFGLVLDSLNNEVINAEFNAIDNGNYERIARRQYLRPQEQELITQLRAGNKVKWGLC